MEVSRSKLLLLALAVGLLCTEMGLSSAFLADEPANGEHTFTSWKQGLHSDPARTEPLVDEDEDHSLRMQRLLVGITPHISYGALRADNTRCPPMSGRSYYLPNCRTASGPANPYERGCLTITRCGRDTS